MTGRHHADGERLDLLSRAVPSGFEVRAHVLEPGCELPYAAAEWRDALVEVDRGEVDLEFRSGDVVRFRAGEVLWLCGLEVQSLHNCGHVPVVLVAMHRRRPDDDPALSDTGFDEKRDGRRLNTHDDKRASRKA